MFPCLGYHAIFASTWYNVVEPEVMATFGQYSRFVFHGWECVWDHTDNRFVVRS